MSQKNEGDLRVRRTRKLLHDALIDLTIERGFAALTVQDIAERAMVNRATFYRHYADKHDLVMSHVRELVDELDQQEASPDDALDQAPETLARLLQHVADHAAFYRVILGKGGMEPFGAHIRSYVEQHLRRRFALACCYPEQARVPVELCVSFMASAALGAITWWLDHDLPYTAEQLAMWLPQLTMQGLNSALGLDVAPERM